MKWTAYFLFLLVSCRTAADDSSVENVFLNDHRAQVTSNHAPWSSIGKLINLNDNSWCTATLIAPNYILSAAHCVAEDDGSGLSNGHVNGNYVFYPMFANGPAAAQASVSYFWWGTSQPAHERNHDWLIGKLDAPLGNAAGWLGWSCPTGADLMTAPLSQKTLYVGAYSGDYQNGDVASWEQGCNFTQNVSGQGFVLHNCDTSRGASGAAIFYYDDPAQPSTSGRIIAINVADRRDGGPDSLINIPYTDNHANIAVPMANVCNSLAAIVTNGGN